MTMEEAMAVEVGRCLMTDFSGTWTQHRLATKEDGHMSQTGVMFQVEPPVRKSGGGGIDAGWFHLMPEGECDACRAVP